jgi:hypothetical protein
MIVLEFSGSRVSQILVSFRVAANSLQVPYFFKILFVTVCSLVIMLLSLALKFHIEDIFSVCRVASINSTHNVSHRKIHRCRHNFKIVVLSSPSYAIDSYVPYIILKNLQTNHILNE